VSVAFLPMMLPPNIFLVAAVLKAKGTSTPWGPASSCWCFFWCPRILLPFIGLRFIPGFQRGSMRGVMLWLIFPTIFFCGLCLPPPGVRQRNGKNNGNGLSGGGGIPPPHFSLAPTGEPCAGQTPTASPGDPKGSPRDLRCLGEGPDCEPPIVPSPAQMGEAHADQALKAPSGSGPRPCHRRSWPPLTWKPTRHPGAAAATGEQCCYKPANVQLQDQMELQV